MEKLPTILASTKELIRKTLVHFKGDMTKSAQSLGIARATLYRHTDNYDINLADLRKPMMLLPGQANILFEE